MPLFTYKAVTNRGELVQGEIDAVTREVAVDRLLAQGYTPLEAEPALTSRAGAPPTLFSRAAGAAVRARDVSDLTRQLATLLGAGLDLDRAMTVLVDTSERPPVAALLSGLQQELRAGRTLADALAATPGVFSPLYTSMVRAGEAAGALPQVLERLADYLERLRALREAILSALIYPMILLTVAGASIVVLVTIVLPRFATLFAESGAPLPLLTQIVLGTGGFATRYGVLIAAILAAGVVLALRHYRSARGRVQIDRLLLKAPLLGSLIAKLAVARFSHTLGTLLANGVALVPALGIARTVLGNAALAQAVGVAEDRLRAGAGLAAPLLETGVFPRHALHMLRVGEETGDLAAMLAHIGNAYEREAHQTVVRLLALLEPVLIVGLGALVAIIVLALLLALLAIGDLPV